MGRFLRLAVLSLALATRAAGAETSSLELEWSALPGIPTSSARTGVFAGISGDALIIAGGVASDVTSTAIGEHNKFSDEIFILESPAAQWRRDSVRLPRPLAFGVCVTWDDQFICVGGTVGTEQSDQVLSLRWNGKSLVVSELPRLPRPISHACGAMLGDTIYIAGGASVENRPTKSFWSLNLRTKGSQWKVLDPWPGAARADAVAAAQDESFLVFGGRSFDSIAGSSAASADLLDGYRYIPQSGWKPIARLPCSVASAPTPGIALGQSHVLVMSGAQTRQQDDGKSRGSTPAEASLPTGVFAYHTITDTWRLIAPFPTTIDTSDGTVRDLRTSPQLNSRTTWWRKQFVLVGGQTNASVTATSVISAEPRRLTPRMHFVDYLCLLAYPVVLIAIAMRAPRQKQGTESYFLAEHRVPWLAAGISILANSISALTFLAIPALVYRTNWVYYLGNLMIVAIAPIVIYFYLPFFRRLNVTTAYEYLEQRFGVSARLLGSSAYVFYQLARMGAVVYLPALALAAMMGFNVYWCIVAIGIVATVYTTVGGIRAVIWTEVLEVAALVGGVVLSLAVIVRAMPGGIGQILEIGRDAGKFHAVNMTWDVTTTALWVVVVGNCLKFLIPYTSDQTVVQRYLVTPDERRAARSIWTNAVLSVPVWTLFFALGTALWTFYKTYPDGLDPFARNDEIFPSFMIRQLPPGAAGILALALLITGISSLQGGMNSMATAIVTDFYRRFRPDAGDDHCLRLAKLATIVLGIASTGCALYMAFLQGVSVWDQFLKIMGLFGGGLGGLFLAGIFTRRTHEPGILVGFFGSAIILYFVQESGAVHFFLYGGIGMLSCFAIGWLASWILPAKPRDITGLTVFTTLQKERAAGATGRC